VELVELRHDELLNGADLRRADDPAAGAAAYDPVKAFWAQIEGLMQAPVNMQRDLPY
jgi:hypothetical protein